MTRLITIMAVFSLSLTACAGSTYESLSLAGDEKLVPASQDASTDSSNQSADSIDDPASPSQALEPSITPDSDDADTTISTEVFDDDTSGAYSTQEDMATEPLVDKLAIEESSASGMRVVGGCVLQPRTQCKDADLGGAVLFNVDLTGAQLQNTFLRRTVGSRSNFTDANLSGADASSSTFLQANMTRARMHNADFGYASLGRSNFNEVVAWYSKFLRADLNGASLVKSVFLGAEFREANLDRANFTEANLRIADFRGASITGTIFTNADLTGATWVNYGVCRAGSIGRCIQ